jgi:hypothetical protein
VVERRKELEEIKRAGMGDEDMRKEFLKYCGWARGTKRSPGAAYGRFVSAFKGRKPLPQWQREAGITWKDRRPVWVTA